MTLIRRVTFVAYLLCFIHSPEAHAVGSSGFENASLSAESLSRGNAVVADPDSPDTVAFNPAGLAKIKTNDVSTGVSLITSNIEYHGAEGRVDENGSKSVIPVPYFYAAMQTPYDPLVVGFGMNAPFGLITKYSSTGNFKHIAYYNELKTVAYHASLGLEVTPEISIGAGITRMDLALKQVGKFNSMFLTGTAQDASFEYDVEGSGYGYNLGLFWTPSGNDSIGVFYRSEVRTHLKGMMSTHELTGVMATVFGGTSHETSADTDLSLPANITIGYNHAFSNQFDLEFDLGWTGWSSYDSFDSVFGNSNAILAGFEHLGKDFEDVFTLHLGGDYEIDKTTTISAGYIYFQMASNENTYTNEIPDGDRHYFAIGIEKKFRYCDFVATYSYSFSETETIENNSGISNGADIDGDYFVSYHILSTGIRFSF